MRALAQMFCLEGTEVPRAEIKKVASLYFDTLASDNVYGHITTETELYFRRLATAADTLADQVGQTLADQKTSTASEAATEVKP